MMREYLFRGIRKDNGKWGYGFPYINRNCNYEIVFCDPKINFQRISFEVIPDTVGQYTGFKDKNGTKIFEGDIIDFPDRTDGDGYGVVRYDADETEFAIIYDSYYRGLGRCYRSRDVEVIGNIYDNPELLEV